MWSTQSSITMSLGCTKMSRFMVWKQERSGFLSLQATDPSEFRSIYDTSCREWEMIRSLVHVTEIFIFLDDAYFLLLRSMDEQFIWIRIWLTRVLDSGDE